MLCFSAYVLNETMPWPSLGVAFLYGTTDRASTTTSIDQFSVVPKYVIPTPRGYAIALLHSLHAWYPKGQPHVHHNKHKKAKAS
jgi:hypothetical protein